MESYPSSGGISKELPRSLSDSIVAYRTKKEIVCCFHTLVFRIAALDEKYPGGHRAFLEGHQVWHNEHIMAVFYSGDARRRVLRDLGRFNLLEGPDWVQLDEDSVNWSWDMFKFDTQASWLKGRYKKGSIYIRYQRTE